MIARAAEKPLAVRPGKAALAGRRSLTGPPWRKRIALAPRAAARAREGRNIVRMRKHAMWYLAGLPAPRNGINGCVSVEDFDEVFDELLACARACRRPRVKRRSCRTIRTRRCTCIFRSA